jgi:predicted aspartyl protease
MDRRTLAGLAVVGFAGFAAPIGFATAADALAPMILATVSGAIWAPAIASAQTPAQSPTGAPASPDAASASEAPDNAAGNLALSHDAASRLTVSVMVDGKGPFNFVIDTGSDRTVISRELASQLELPKGPDVTLHESAGVEQIETAVISRLSIGKRVVEAIDAPVLAAANLGADGMLGIDSLRDEHVVMDFKNNTLSATPSTSVEVAPFTIVVRGRSKFGQLILVDAQVRGRKVYVIVDSGAQNTIGNLALQRLLISKGAPVGEKALAEEISVTGRRSTAEIQNVAEMHIGALTIRNMRLAFADLHTFDRYGLSNQPAMLLGMDVLSLCDRVTVDFDRREATFTLR